MRNKDMVSQNVDILIIVKENAGLGTCVITKLKLEYANYVDGFRIGRNNVFFLILKDPCFD